MTKTKRNTLYTLFKGLSIVISCLLPLWGVYEKFPIWIDEHGMGNSLGVGGVIGIFILLVIFRRTVFGYLKDKWKMKYAPPITIWGVMIVISYMLMFINKFLYDLTIVFWMGLIGCAIGAIFTFIAENFFAEEEKKNE